MIKESVCLSLFNDNGVEIFAKWFGNLHSARCARNRNALLFKTGYVWVIWTFDNKGNRLLLSSSRPLGFRFVEA